VENLINGLIAEIQAMGLHGGLENALISKLQNALAEFQAGNNTDAVNILNAFINQCNAQRGKKLTEAQADELIAAAQAIIDQINSSAAAVAKASATANRASAQNPSVLASLPAGYALEQNYPNPFNPETGIRFALPEASQVTVKIFSITGQEIRTLANGAFQAGYQTVRWDGRNQSGHAAAGGVYFYQITATGANGEVKFTQTRKMAFVK
jgi:hypothetical protein